MQVNDDHDDFHRWLSYHGGEVRGRFGKPHVRLDIPCSMLVGNRCSVYDERPRLCRNYLCPGAEVD
jgi:Fe-S-cluster containining protein